jgi:hypothetical protein
MKVQGEDPDGNTLDLFVDGDPALWRADASPWPRCCR